MSDEIKRIDIDAGAVYFSAGATAGDPDGRGTLLGATRDGNVFEVRTIRRGFRRVEEVATLTVNLLEITLANLLMALPGSSETNNVITGGEIDDADYIGSVAIVGTMSDPDLPGTSKPIICRLLNCLVTERFISPKDEAVLTVVFEAHFDPADLDTEPWSITYPSD